MNASFSRLISPSVILSATAAWCGVVGWSTAARAQLDSPEPPKHRAAWVEPLQHRSGTQSVVFGRIVDSDWKQPQIADEALTPTEAARVEQILEELDEAAVVPVVAAVRVEVGPVRPTVRERAHNERRLQTLAAESRALRDRMAIADSATFPTATTLTGSSVTTTVPGIPEPASVGVLYPVGTYAGGSVADTAHSAAVHGYADLIRSGGLTGLLGAQAARHYQEALSRALDNAVKRITTRQTVERLALARQEAERLERKETAARLAANRAEDYRAFESASEPELRASNRLFLARKLIAEGKFEAAREWLTDIVQHYPRTAAAGEAGALLRQWN